jgi:hypothetical protein
MQMDMPHETLTKNIGALNLTALPATPKIYWYILVAYYSPRHARTNPGISS